MTSKLFVKLFLHLASIGGATMISIYTFQYADMHVFLLQIFILIFLIPFLLDFYSYNQNLFCI